MNIKIPLILIMLLVTTPVVAISDEERAILLRASDELAMIESIIEQAELAKDSRDREQVSYQAIKDDLATIKAGLQAIIERQRRESRVLPPLTGEYQ